MTDNQLHIRTISPIFSPLNIAAGVDQTSTDYLNMQSRLASYEQDEQRIVMDDRRLDYQSIDSDARDNRIFVWRSELIDNLKIHVFSNNVAMVEYDLFISDADFNDDIAEYSQAQTRLAIEQVYSEFVTAIAGILSQESCRILSLNSEHNTAPHIHWISRILLLNKSQVELAAMQTFLGVWLAHTQRPQDAVDIIDGTKDYSLTWLNYVVIDAKEQNDARIDAVILAQYYYTAQAHCNQLLKQAIDSAYNTQQRSETEQKLSRSRVLTRLHQIDYHEHLNFLNRYKRKLLDEILECWDFDALLDNGQRMIAVCSSKLEEVDNKKRERSTVMTDLLLVTLSFFAVFELSLYLTEFSREMMSRPALDYNDENSSFFLSLIAQIDVDIMFGMGFGLTFLLIMFYKFIKAK